MATIIAFKPATRATRSDRLGRMMENFATARRPMSDVFWLKENAELLGIFAALGEMPRAGDLAAYASFYEEIEARMQFYPQYYRFLLSIALDLEALGMAGNKAEKLCHWVAQQGLAEAELSDLQRAEARRLLQRRGAASQVCNGTLGKRLHSFINRSETFSMPNKKAAYELTHIVYYLSEYGKRDPEISKDAVISLEYTGVLAFLDQNMDLLAEVCAALRFAKETPSDVWTQAVQMHHTSMRTAQTVVPAQMDAYHEYFVTGWASEVAGAEAFDTPLPDGAFSYQTPAPSPSALMGLSACLSDLGDARSSDWDKMRGHALAYLGPEGHEVLLAAEASTDRFEAFFEGFARAALV